MNAIIIAAGSGKRISNKINVIHEGIDTDKILPKKDVGIEINGITYSKKDKTVLFVNRNLEPYRGYHIFTRAIPKILKEKPQITCVIGLNTEAERLVDLRKNRMNSLKETENIKYTNIENIKKEIEDAKKTFRKYRWPSIDVTRKSVEETAASIIKIHEIYLNNVR